MNIIVPVKQVPETEIRPKLSADGKSLDLSSVKMIVNPFDEFAIEAALQLRESMGEGKVTIITVGDLDSVQALRTGLAMGADEAIRIKLEDAPGSDARATAYLLAAAIQDRPHDLILCGKHAVGTDNNQIPQMLAVMLDLPVVSTVSKLEIGNGEFNVQRQIEGKAEVVGGKLPAVISVDKGVNEPRYPSLKGIMAAKRATIEEIPVADLNVDAGILGEEGSPLELLSIELPAAKGAGTIIEIGEDPDGAAEKFVDWLKNQAKVI